MHNGSLHLTLGHIASSPTENDMNREPIFGIAILVTLAALVACSNPGVVKLSDNTYVVSRTSAAGAFTNMAKLRAETIREANVFAASQGKVAVVISDRETVPHTGFPSYEYQFRLVDPDDVRAADAELSLRGESHTENINADIHTTDETEKSEDVYAELLKLDDLRERGILTQAEFETEKKKLLEGN